MKAPPTYAIILIILMVLPFVLTTHFYPFLRFGMYAEPVPDQVEVFVLKYCTRDEPRFRDFDTNIIGLDESMINYTIRHHYYQKKMKAFAKKIQHSYKKSKATTHVSHWQVWRKMVGAQRQDSSLVFRFSQQ